MFKDIREYENMHIVLWLIKDTCWVMTWRVAGMTMIIPTLIVAIHIVAFNGMFSGWPRSEIG